MRRIVKAVLCALVALVMFGCGTTKSAIKINESRVKKPEPIDHKNLKWGKAPPEWVSMERDEIEAIDKYQDVYIFKFESEKSKDLEGTQLWLRNFSATTELSKMITQRIKDVSAAAAAGDKDMYRNIHGGSCPQCKSSRAAWTKKRIRLLDSAALFYR